MSLKSSYNSWGFNNVTNFYSKNRNKVSDLYKSEKILLKKIKIKIRTVLDFGCAAGGFNSIFNKIFKGVHYTGIDFDKEMIRISKQKYSKKSKFILSNTIPKKIKRHDLVFSTGVMNHVKNYQITINKMLRKSKYYTFVDCPRLHEKKKITAKMDLSLRFDGVKKKNIVNYYVENLNNFLKFVKKVYFKDNLNVYFYIENLPYSKKYLNLKSKVYFLTMLFEKNGKKKISVFSSNKKIRKYIYEFFKK